MMLVRVSPFKFAAVISSTLGLLTVLGCGDDTGLAKRYPVSGKVTYKNEPVAKGRIDFIPVKAAEGRSATGDIVDGYYTLTTADKNDGALPGSYKVTVSSVALDASAEAQLKDAAKGGQYHRGPESAKIEKGAVKNVLPSKFVLAETSGLTAEVKAQSNSIDFPLSD